MCNPSSEKPLQICLPTLNESENDYTLTSPISSIKKKEAFTTENDAHMDTTGTLDTSDQCSKKSEPSVLQISLGVSLENTEEKSETLKLKENPLVLMRKFYQNLYVKFVKMIGKEEKSVKGKSLEKMAETLMKKFDPDGTSIQEVIVHIGSIIFPAKFNRRAYKEIPKGSPQYKAQKLIGRFQSCMYFFTNKKFSLFLSSKINNYLYNIYSAHAHTGGTKDSAIYVLTTKLSEIK